jgi:hypothetical protein
MAVRDYIVVLLGSYAVKPYTSTTLKTRAAFPPKRLFSTARLLDATVQDTTI